MTQQGQTGEGKAENNGGRRQAGLNEWLPFARIFIMARSLDCSTKEAADTFAVGPRYDLTRSLSGVATVTRTAPEGNYLHDLASTD